MEESAVIIALRKQLCSLVISSATCLEVPVEGLPKRFQLVGSSEYGKLLKARTSILIDLMEQVSSPLLISDADVVFLKNPLPYLAEKTKAMDVLFQGDRSRTSLLDNNPEFFSHACAGFVYSTNSDSAISLYRSILSYQEGFHWNDQWALNVCLRHPSVGTKWAVLDYSLFMNGHDFFSKQKGRVNDGAFIVHANHLSGFTKWVGMMNNGLWYDTSNIANICRDTIQEKWCAVKNTVYATHPCMHAAEVCAKYGVSIFVPTSNSSS
uniref:Nucleotide-diphospho-sugar transferase domain-containing protein n=1 Tax=Heterosigma akashiwo TaxID=2829 RepID=A0A7S4DD66_HETAK